jgi:hypothetical protein
MNQNVYNPYMDPNVLMGMQFGMGNYPMMGKIVYNFRLLANEPIQQC